MRLRYGSSGMRITDVTGGEAAARDAVSDSPTEGGGASPAVPRLVLGTRLRRLREAQYISRREAAEAIRVTHQRILDLEQGRTGCARCGTSRTC